MFSRKWHVYSPLATLPNDSVRGATKLGARKWTSRNNTATTVLRPEVGASFGARGGLAADVLACGVPEREPAGCRLFAPAV
nr:hypothetical protein CFP56_01021 [Quercus suber]